jgi:chemotaxis protein methyltransferase CheR
VNAAQEMDNVEIEKIEIELFLEGLYRRYGYDFRQYARASVGRRVRNLLSKTGSHHICDLLAPMLHDEEFAQQAIYEFSITVTEMFRDPNFYSALREKVVPYLKTYPFIRVWVAGCSTGEEVYSLAILLLEEDLYKRSTIFATDFNELALKKAQNAIYPLKDMQQYTTNYQHSGGKASFADYYHAEYGSAIIDQALKTNITFANHNLVTDGVFSEMHLILCRNVLIYFDRNLQNRALGILAESLGYAGFLCLGTKETIEFSGVRDQFRSVNAGQGIFQKQAT